MRRAVIAGVLGLALTMPTDEAAHGQSDLVRQCRQAVSARYPQWQPPAVDPAVRDWARSRNEDPIVAFGDFDDDGTQDVALLVRIAPPPRSMRIVVCLSSLGSAKPVVIDNPYCSDGITRVPKGTQYSVVDSNVEGTYPKDGIHAYCFEKAGATYIFSNGAFQMTVDSD